MAPRPDDELLASWGDGDDVAGEELVGRYVPVLHRFFSSKLSHDIEDLALATFMACVKQREHFRREASFKTHLLSIARPPLMMYLRKRYRGGRTMRMQELSIEQVVGSPSVVAGHKEELELLHRVMQTLPLDLQITLELYYWEELPVAEIGELLEIPTGTVKSRLARARESLKDKLSQADAHGTCARQPCRISTPGLDVSATNLGASF